MDELDTALDEEVACVFGAGDVVGEHVADELLYGRLGERELVVGSGADGSLVV